MAAESAPRLGWIGLGNMGRGMVKNLSEKAKYSSPIVIYNRTFARTEKLVSTLEKGKAKAVKSIAEVVKEADIIFTCVANDAAIQETIDEALKVPESKSKLFVECSTIHPDLTNSLAKQITDAGANFVANPVFGAPAMADSGQLVCVLAGPWDLVDRVKPFCDGVMGRAHIDFSDQPCGKATLLKVLGNTFILNMVQTLSEGHVAAEKSGLGVENLHRFVETMFPGPYTAYSTRMTSGDYWKREEPLFAAPLARKDAGHARKLAQSAGVEMKALELADARMAKVVDHAGDKGDIAGLYGAVRQENGLKFEN